MKASGAAVINAGLPECPPVFSGPERKAFKGCMYKARAGAVSRCVMHPCKFAG